MIFLGLDIGAVGLKAAILGTGTDAATVLDLAVSSVLFNPDPIETDLYDSGRGTDGHRNDRCGAAIATITYRRTRGRPLEAARTLMKEVLEVLRSRGVLGIDGVRVTGSGSGLIRASFGYPEENEFRALAVATRVVAPDTRTLFEIGGESSKLLFFEHDETSGDLGISDFQTNGDCAAGTGAFLDQQAGRLQYEIEEVGAIAAGTDRTAKIAGRCSVFAKSDMIHAQQKGYLPPEVLRGLCETVARNFLSAVAKGKTPRSPILFVGGVASNEMVVTALRSVFELDDEIVVPIHHASHAAIGCVVREASESGHVALKVSDLGLSSSEGGEIPFARPLSMEKVVLLRDRVRPVEMSANGPPIEVAMGIDIGSVSTNVVLLDREGRVVREIYTRTQARPVEVVTGALDEIRRELGDRVIVRGVGTTGSGRELIGELVGADSINDEITAHKTGAAFIARTMLGCEVNTIFEIGGQDAKFIRIEDGIVVDFAMNEACAAGTGSFLEERADELGVVIKEEFARRALSSTTPVRLGERCTVFMERDVTAYQQCGAETNDLIAGLALSVATNYINRVVRGRKIEGTIFFQGGTAYNDAVAAAFSQILDREIIVPPYNGVVGAVGAALLAWEKADRLQAGTRFRGWDLRTVDYRIREFTCPACENRCDVQEFRVEGEKTYWGDQCGDRYRRRAKVEFRPVIDDLVRLRKEWLLDEYRPDEIGARGTVAFPRAMYHHERFPYWNALLRALGFSVRLTSETNRSIASRGVEAAVAEPCFPIQVAHGHVVEALGMQDARFILIPNMVNSEQTHPDIQSFYCPWGTTLPFVLRSAESIEKGAGRIVSPLIRFRAGKEAVIESLASAFRSYGVAKKEIRSAVVEAERAYDVFRNRIREAGDRAMTKLSATGEPAILLIGRPYNLFDGVVNLELPRKLRDLYGVNVLPLEFLRADETDIQAFNSNMYWGYGRKILAVAREASRHPNIHMIYVTNFKCGPDSYIKHFVRDAFGRPFLTLQFDGHANDAGMLTRVEAFLDSQGILRRWNARPERNTIQNTMGPVDVPRFDEPVSIPVNDCTSCAGAVSCLSAQRKDG
jgi:predicted CoA-substrate-specific enzyme activase